MLNEAYLQAIVTRITQRATDKADTWQSHHDRDIYCYLRHGIRDTKIVFDSCFSGLKRSSVTKRFPIDIDSQTILKNMLKELGELRSCYHDMPGDDGIYQDMSAAMIEADLKELIAAHYQPSESELAEAIAFLEKRKR